jgi:hypothetical protein
MKKEFLQTITFVLGFISMSLYLFTNNVLAFGFGLLFCIMFIVDSLQHFVKVKLGVGNSFEAVGGDYASKNSSSNK